MGRQIGSEISKGTDVRCMFISNYSYTNQSHLFSLLIIEVINNIRFHDIEPIQNNSNYL